MIKGDVTMTIRENYIHLQKEIERICEARGRDPKSVHVVAVTKYIGIEKTKEAIAAGIKHIGENRSHGFNEKWEAIKDGCTWHFIGTLQSRKVKDVINRVDYLHSLDRLSLAKEVDKRLEKGRVLNCFVQVNVSGEETKFGLKPDEVIPFIRQLEPFQGIRVIGLMTMAPFYEDAERTRPVFRKLRELRDEVKALNLRHAPCTELSMGMSNDYKVALEEGATFIRIGSALVGREHQ